MEAMKTIGFTFGLAGLYYAINATNDIKKINIVFENFKASLKTPDASNRD